MNLRTTSHAFYLSRHGQSEYNDLGRIGGDSGLTIVSYSVTDMLVLYVLDSFLFSWYIKKPKNK